MELMAQAAEGRGTRDSPQPSKGRLEAAGRRCPGLGSRPSSATWPALCKPRATLCRAFTELRTELLSDEDTEAHVTQLVSELRWS